VYNKEEDFVLVVSVDKYSFPSGHASRCIPLLSAAVLQLSLQQFCIPGLVSV